MAPEPQVCFPPPHPVLLLSMDTPEGTLGSTHPAFSPLPFPTVLPALRAPPPPGRCVGSTYTIPGLEHWLLVS